VDQERAMKRWTVCIMLATSLLSGVSLASSMWSDHAPPVPAVALTDQDGKAWQLQQLIHERPVLINFFFTGCRSICPTQTVQMQKVMDEVARKSGDHVSPLFLSISLDPMGDTPEAIQQFIKKFEIKAGEQNNWLFLHGSFEDLEPVWKAFQQPLGASNQHDALFWIGRPSRGLWTRAGALSSEQDMAKLLLESEGP
jgi:protein SCO1